MDLDLDLYLRFLVALALVLALILVLAWIAKRLGYGSAAAGRIRPGRRLAVVEVLAVDARRKLVLVRRDDREHLILLGPQQDCVIEQNIEPPQLRQGEAGPILAPQGGQQ